jgi:hypothetical protein
MLFYFTFFRNAVVESAVKLEACRFLCCFVGRRYRTFLGVPENSAHVRSPVDFPSGPVTKASQ